MDIAVRKLSRFLVVSELVLGVSAGIDLVQWIRLGYMVPCWAISLMSLAAIMLVEVIRRQGVK